MTVVVKLVGKFWRKYKERIGVQKKSIEFFQ